MPSITKHLFIIIYLVSLTNDDATFWHGDCKINEVSVWVYTLDTVMLIPDFIGLIGSLMFFKDFCKENKRWKIFLGKISLSLI